MRCLALQHSLSSLLSPESLRNVFRFQNYSSYPSHPIPRSLWEMMSSISFCFLKSFLLGTCCCLQWYFIPRGGLGNIWLPRAQQKSAGCHFTRSSMGFKRKPQNFTLWKTFTYQHTLTQKHWNQTKHGISPSCLTKSLYWYLEWVYHPSLPLSCYQRTRQLLSVILQKGGSWK